MVICLMVDSTNKSGRDKRGGELQSSQSGDKLRKDDGGADHGKVKTVDFRN